VEIAASCEGNLSSTLGFHIRGEKPIKKLYLHQKENQKLSKPQTLASHWVKDE